MRISRRTLQRCGIVALWCSLATVASAQEESTAASDADRAAAQVLFDQGRDLFKAEAYQEACAKFAESMRLDRAIGTQLNLANCYEKLGRLASAWINFEEARARASKEGMSERVAIASEHATALEGRLSKMKIVVSDDVEGMTVTRDGERVGEPQWGIDVPVDGGSHVIEATAPGKKPWRTTVEVQAEGDQVEVSVPPLEDAPVVPEPTPDVPPPPAPDNTGLWVGAGVAGGLGLAGIGVGVAFGLLASNKNDESAAHCTVGPNECSGEGVALRDDAFIMAHVSTTGFVVGGVGIAAGVLLMVVALTEDGGEGSDSATLWPRIDAHGDGAALRWAW